MSDAAHLTISRATSYADRLRSYKVAVDGAVVTSVAAGESVSVPVAAGSHTVRLKIDWCGSESISFTAQPGDRIDFECGNNAVGLLALYCIAFRPRKYLWLRRMT